MRVFDEKSKIQASYSLRMQAVCRVVLSLALSKKLTRVCQIAGRRNSQAIDFNPLFSVLREYTRPPTVRGGQKSRERIKKARPLRTGLASHRRDYKPNAAAETVNAVRG